MDKRMVVTRCCRDIVAEDGAPVPGVVPRTIPLHEWLAHVESNPALTLVRLAANEDDALGAAHPVRLSDRSTDRWLYWASGEIHADGPDPVLLDVMLATARALGARVRHEDIKCLQVPADGDPSVPGHGDDGRSAADEDALAERRATQVLVVAGAIACAASVMWLMQA